MSVDTFLSRLCALVPPPRFHMTRYYGVFGLRIGLVITGIAVVIAKIGHRPSAIAELASSNTKIAPATRRSSPCRGSVIAALREAG